MREANKDINRFDRPQGNKRAGFDEQIISCVIFLFLIVLIALVSMLQSSRIRFLEQRIQTLEKEFAAATSDLIWKEDATRWHCSDVPFH